MIEDIAVDFIVSQLVENYSGLRIIQAWGETSLFYNPDDALKRGIYFCTFKNKDGTNDKASHLYRKDVFRMNFGISKKTFVSVFNTIPKRPVKGGIIVGAYDFQAYDILTPHPIYGWMAWVSILNPSKFSLQKLKIFIDESYELCTQKYKNKIESGALSGASTN